MIEAQLFFGFPLDSLFEDKLKRVNPQLVALFLDEGSQYLQEFKYNEQCYLGKFVGNTVTLSHLVMLEVNIYSLLKKIVPDYPYEKIPLVMIPVAHTSKEVKSSIP